MSGFASFFSVPKMKKDQTSKPKTLKSNHNKTLKQFDKRNENDFQPSLTDFRFVFFFLIMKHLFPSLPGIELPS